MLSYQAIVFLQCGQKERGRTRDFSCGVRCMQPFKKLPRQLANTNTTIRQNQVIIGSPPKLYALPRPARPLPSTAPKLILPDREARLGPPRRVSPACGRPE